MYKSHKIEYSKPLTEIALAFENESSPCNYDINVEGDSLVTFFESHTDRYQKALLVSYEGEYTENADDILLDLLKNGKIDQDGFNGNYDEMGVACACNSINGMECLVIFGDRVKIKGSSRFNDDFTEIAGIEECETRCPYDIFID